MPDSKPEPRKLYWDSCVFLAYIDDEPDRASNIGALLNEAEEKKVEIYTSVASITEVAFGASEKSGGRLIEEVEDNIRSLWTPSSPVRLVEVSLLVVEDAREIMRSGIDESAKIAKPMDAIHLASAKRLGVDELHTYDGDMRRIATRIGLANEEPNPDNMPLF